MMKLFCIVLSVFTHVNVCSKHLEVKKYPTPISEENLKEVLYQSHIDVFHITPSDNTVNMAWAQIAFENGKGKLVYNYNLGNIGTFPKARHPYYRVAGNKFKSFSSFREGAANYWKVIKNRCRSSLPHFNWGDPYNSSLFLKKCSYYKLDLESYYSSMKLLFNEARRVKSIY